MLVVWNIGAAKAQSNDSSVTQPDHTPPDTTGGFSHHPHGGINPPPTYPPDTGKYDYRKWPILIIPSLMWPILIIPSLILQVDSHISHMVPTLLHPLILRIQVNMIIESDPSWSYPVWCDPSWSYPVWWCRFSHQPHGLHPPPPTYPPDKVNMIIESDPSWSYPVWCDLSWSYSAWYYWWILTSATWSPPSSTHLSSGYR